MNANEKDWALARKLWNAGINGATVEHARILRRAEMTLHRWYEYECGVDDGRGGTYCIERDEGTGKPKMYRHTALGEPYGWSTPDRENGALARVAALCEAIECYYYVQTDPRGAVLYVSPKPMDNNNYHRGVCCCGRD